MRNSILLLMWLLISVVIAQDDSKINITNYYYTHHRADGNRLISGTGTFPDVKAVDLSLGGVPIWVIGAGTTGTEHNTHPVWVIILEDGSLQGTFFDSDDKLSISPVLPETLTPGMPTVLVFNEMGTFPRQTFPQDASPFTHPVYIDNHAFYVAIDGNFVLLENDSQIAHLDLNALPDARIVLSENRAALYTNATDKRYVHSIMGDSLEGASLHVVDINNFSILTEIHLKGDEVFEGISPMWADVDEDGDDDLITTVSFGGGGAQLRVYDADNGSLIASSDAIGRSNRWRHQLAWGAFGPEGQNELVEVLTPHIHGIVGHFRYDGMGRLERVTRFSGYTSHIINSRNLDMAIAGDFNANKILEIVLPNQERTKISGIEHTADGAAVSWSLPLGSGKLASNLSAVTLTDGRLALAAAITNDDGGGYLRVWLPI